MNKFLDGIENDETEDSWDDEQDSLSYKVSYYPADITLKGYLDKHNAKQLVYPGFQRRYVWDQERASKLIESFLLGLPVPAVFLYKEQKTNKLVVIDGQQRILTAINYFNNSFIDKPFALINVKEKWRGKKFHDLSEEDQYQVNDSVLRAIIIQHLGPEDDSSIYQIFARLNTGGMNLNDMEIRRCVFAGPFVQMIEDLNNNLDWRTLLGRKEPDNRYLDMECLLRVLAFRKNEKNFHKPMKTFLNQYLVQGKKSMTHEQDIRDTKEMFRKTCKYILDELGEKPFFLSIRRLNYAILDSLFCVCSEAMEMGMRDIKERVENLKKDPDFINNVKYNTSDQNAVRMRFKCARKYIIGIEE